MSLCHATPNIGSKRYHWDHEKEAIIKLSIIVSTYNRPDLYKKLCNSLNSQISKDVELVTINGVTGLAKARNLGWQKAKGDYTAFIDDDAIASPTWVKAILAFIKSHPNVVAFGGPYASSNQDSIPTWIPREVTSKILPGRGAHKLNLGSEWLNGTNMIFKRSILKKLDGFDESLGITGNKRGYGEETDLQIRIHNLGHDIWYDPKIMVEHYFAKFKQNIWYLLKNQFTHGKNSRAIFHDFTISTQSKTASTSWARLKQKNISLVTRIYYLLSPLFYLFGSLASRINI